jgi:dTDP-glucose 4,6-dehydratase
VLAIHPPFIKNLPEGMLPVYGDGLNVRDWLYVEDHARALTLVVEHGTAGETYNIGSRNERTNIDVVEKICDLLDAKEPLGKGPRRRLITCVADRPGHDRRYVIDPAKIEGQLGWRPAHIFEQGLVKTVQWYLRNAAWWQPILERGYRTTRIGLADRFDGSGSHRKVIGAEIVSSVGMPLRRWKTVVWSAASRHPWPFNLDGRKSN